MRVVQSHFVVNDGLRCRHQQGLSLLQLPVYLPRFVERSDQFRQVAPSIFAKILRLGGRFLEGRLLPP